MCFSQSTPMGGQHPLGFAFRDALRQKVANNPLLRGKTAFADNISSPEISSSPAGISAPNPTLIGSGSQNTSTVAPRRALGILQNIKTRR